MVVKAKELRFDVEVDAAGALRVDADWAPEHLVLAGLVRCSLTSFRHAASRRGLDGTGSGRASGIVTRRADDGLYAFVAIEVELEVVVAPPLGDGLADLVAHAERGCFIGNSLTAKPRYHWVVNGAAVASASA